MHPSADITLTICPFCELETPPIGIAILRSALRRQGLTARVIDLNAEELAAAEPDRRLLWDRQRYLMDLMDPARFVRLLPELDPILERCVARLLSTPARFIGFSTFNQNMRVSAEIAARIRRADPSRKIIFGGPSCLVAAERQWVPEGAVDAFVVGDGEEALPGAMAALDADQPSAMAGVVFTCQDDPGAMVEPALLSDLSRQPVPDYGEHPLDLYRAADPSGELELPIVGSRGCFMTCAFCNERGLIKRYRSRTGEAIFDEMRRLHERHGAARFNFTDAAFNGRPAVLERLADLILEHDLSLRWRAQAIPRGDMSRELMTKLRRAGLTSVTYGVESAAPHVLKLMRRDHSWLAPGKALRRTRAAGVEVAINLMVGFPGETEEDFQQTLDFVRKNRDHVDRVDNIHPFFISPLSAVERAPETFGIQQLPDGPMARAMEWVGPEGNTYERRKERVVRLCQALRAAGIPFDESQLNVYDQTAEVQPDEPTPDAGEPAVALDDVALLGDGERAPDGAFSPGDRLTVLFRYRVCHPGVADPLFRVQVFMANRPDSGESMVFGSNTDRAGLHIGPLEVGPGEARLTLHQLNMAGQLRVVAGVWPEEMAPEAYDIWQGPLSLNVQGGGLVHQPAEVEVEPGQAPAAGLAVDDGHGLEDAPLRAGEQLVARLGVDPDQRGSAAVCARVFRGQDMVSQADAEVTLPGGPQLVRVRFAPLNLLGGSYRLRFTLSVAGEQLASVDQGFQVRSGRTDGAGLARHHATWTVDHNRQR